LSFLSAPTAAVPPCLFTSFELTIPSDVFVRIDGIAAFGVFDLSTTVYLPRAATVTPSSRNDGFPLMLIRRRKENTASAAVSGVPSAKCTSLRRLKTYVFAPLETDHDLTSSGTGCATSPPL
jgi:hypothetical protein